MVNQAEIIDRLRLEIETVLREYPELADDEVARLDTLEGATDIREVLIGLAKKYGLTEANIVAIQAYQEELIGSLALREKRYEARKDFLRALMSRLMDSAQLRKIELPIATLSFRNNQPRVVGDTDPNLLPDDLCNIKRTVDKKAVRAAIEAGRDVPGFVLSNAAPSLSVRVK